MAQRGFSLHNILFYDGSKKQSMVQGSRSVSEQKSTRGLGMKEPQTASEQILMQIQQSFFQSK